MNTGRIVEYLKERRNEWITEWRNAFMKEWTHGESNDGMNDMNVLINECMDGCM